MTVAELCKAKVKQLKWTFDGSGYVGTAGEFKFYIKISWSQATPFEVGVDYFKTLPEAQEFIQSAFEEKVHSALEA